MIIGSYNDSQENWECLYEYVMEKRLNLKV